MAAEKKQPLRRCAGCGLMKEKRDLMRIVRKQDGSVVPDPSGRMNGRGVYLCRDISCLEKAARNRGIERSLKCSIAPEVYEELRRELDGQ